MVQRHSPTCLVVVPVQALTLLEHLVKNGAERIVEDVRDHMHKIRTLTDFNYYEGSQDRGSGGEGKRTRVASGLMGFST